MKKVNMKAYVAHAIPHNTNIDPYIVGVYSSYEMAEKANLIEEASHVEKNIYLYDVHECVVNQIDALKVQYYEESSN